ncbi:solute carrier family 2, facilitated glucose transporter member 6-like [Leguminivora glycinivorella]|uniref:solute carrier family 2, facilitated glucose transporter member 6-like n=1 Tax=Leguminivora glycinivorella TaxID=1035111 RepID=UPI00200C3A62|nr:solute carrier family 2, facilitated glucose transporter member 6-like [Leguminivora glycinivorella]
MKWMSVTIGNLTVGYTTGWATSIIPKLKDPLQTSLTYLILDKDGYTMIRVMVFGAVLGSLISGFTANRVGRKPCLIFTSSLNILGYSIMANAVDVTTMSVGRFIAGMAAGSIAVVNVVYLGEIASPEIRGAILAMGGIMHVFGSLLVCSLGPYVCVEVVCYVCVGVGCVHVCVLCYVPESPVYQVMKGIILD